MQSALKYLFNTSFIVFLSISCNSTNSTTRDLKKHLVNIEKQIIKDDSGIENFRSFLDFFKQDTSFQFERTTSPYITRIELVTINEAGDLKAVINTSFDSSDWESLTGVFKEPQFVELKNDSAIITHCEDMLYRNICTNYIFTRSFGKWYFKTLEINTNSKAL